MLASGDQMVNAQVGVDQTGLPAVDVTLNSAAGQRMFDYTSANVGKLMSVVYIERIPTVTMVDGKEVRSVRSRAGDLGRRPASPACSASSSRPPAWKAEADNLAAAARRFAGRADGLRRREHHRPEPGAENIERGITAVVYAFVFTLVFFTIYYRMFGVITSIALLLNLLIVVAVMSMFGATMTLPGFAGLALSVGLSVDANVLINERIREELRHGMPPKTAIQHGYDRAGGTIMDANLTGLIVGIALYVFGTGPLKGFALTMIIGIFASMFTAITVSRAIATLLYGRRKNLKTVAI